METKKRNILDLSIEDHYLDLQEFKKLEEGQLVYFSLFGEKVKGKIAWKKIDDRGDGYVGVNGIKNGYSSFRILKPEDSKVNISKELTNKEFIEMLSKYPENAIITIEYCNPREMIYDKENNLIKIN